jgi:hypothetical protein
MLEGRNLIYSLGLGLILLSRDDEVISTYSWALTLLQMKNIFFFFKCHQKMFLYFLQKSDCLFTPLGILIS